MTVWIFFIFFCLECFRLSRVCSLWWRVSTTAGLWHTVDLATGRVKEKFRTERHLFWLLEHRLGRVQDLALGNGPRPPFLTIVEANDHLSFFLPTVLLSTTIH